MSDPVSDTSPLGLIIKNAAESRLRFIDNCTSVGVSVANGQTAEALLTVEVDSLRNILAPFTRRLNALRCSFLRLPPEVLRLIFKSVMEGEEHHPTEWLFLGHICAVFRSTLLDMHSVWAGVVFSTELRGAHEELLRRAHDASITVDFDHDTEPSQEMIEFAVTHLTRSRTISTGSTEALRAFIRRMRSATSFPFLESVDLHARVGAYPLEGAWVDEELPSITTVYPSSTFNTPALQKLRLINIFLPFDPSTLTTLDLSRPSETLPPPSLPPMPFLDMLRLCVNVQELSLSHWVPEFEAAIVLTEPPVELPALRTLDLSGHQLRVLPLWPLLRIPTTAVLTITWMEETDYSTMIKGASSFAGHVIAWTSRSLASSASRLEIMGASDEGYLTLCIFALDDVECPSPYREFKQPRNNQAWIPIFRIQLFIHRWDHRDVGRAIQEFCSTFELANVSTLDVSWEIVQKADPSVFTHFPAVQTLRLEWPTSDVIWALNAPPPASHPPSTFMYPALHTLAISTTENLLPDEVDALYDVLIERIGHGAPVQVLDFEVTNAGDDEGDEEEEEDTPPPYLDTFAEIVSTVHYEPS